MLTALAAPPQPRWRTSWGYPARGQASCPTLTPPTGALGVAFCSSFSMGLHAGLPRGRAPDTIHPALLQLCSACVSGALRRSWAAAAAGRVALESGLCRSHLGCARPAPPLLCVRQLHSPHQRRRVLRAARPRDAGALSLRTDAQGSKPVDPRNRRTGPQPRCCSTSACGQSGRQPSGPVPAKARGPQSQARTSGWCSAWSSCRRAAGATGRGRACAWGCC